MEKLRTNNKSRGTNTKEYIVLHHTGTKENTTKGNINACINGKVSFHYLVNEFGEVFKFNTHNDILRHAGESQRDGKKMMNSYSIGIETIGPLSNGGFTPIQKKAVDNLIKKIMSEENIPPSNLLRHADISPGRKTDISPTFYAPLSRTQYQQSFTSITNKDMTQKQKDMLIVSLMNLASSLHPEIQNKEIQDTLAKVNELFRASGYTNG